MLYAATSSAPTSPSAAGDDESFLDYFPLRLGDIRGFGTQIHLYGWSDADRDSETFLEISSPTSTASSSFRASESISRRETRGSSQNEVARSRQCFRPRLRLRRSGRLVHERPSRSFRAKPGRSTRCGRSRRRSSPSCGPRGSQGRFIPILPRPRRPGSIVEACPATGNRWSPRSRLATRARRRSDRPPRPAPPAGRTPPAPDCPR